MRIRFPVSAMAVCLISVGGVGDALGRDAISLEPVALDLGRDEASPKPERQPLPASGQPSASPPLTLGTTKIGIPADKAGSFATIVTREQIRQMQATSLVDVLRGVPGLDVVQSGGPGQSASIFIRGMNAEHTLLLIDGIEANDPVSPGRTFNFPDQVSLDSIERIEILRGPHSPLYGSDAIGGVINVVTEPGQGRPSLTARVQAGSYGTVQEDVALRGGLVDDRLGYDFHLSRRDVAGFSSAGSRYGNGERDGFHNTALAGRVTLRPLPNASLDLLTRYSDSRTDLDNAGGYGGDDPNAVFRNKTLLLGARSRVSLFKDRFEQITRLSVANHWRRNENDADPEHPFDRERSRFNSQLLKLEAQNNFYVNPANTLTAGFEASHERGEFTNDFQSLFGPFVSEFSERSATTLGFYLQDYIRLGERWFTTAGVRWDGHNRFGGTFTYRGASTFLVPKAGTILRASYGTGFKAPSLYQLYSSFGNPDLAAERSKGWDMGLEQPLFKDRLRVGATCFYNRVNDMLQFNPGTFIYENTGKARMQGSEVYATVSPFKSLMLRTGYTYTHTRDLRQHEALLRRPRHKVAVNVNFQPTEKLNLNLDIVRLGSRDDLDFSAFPAIKVKLAPYTLVNLAVSYKLTRYCTILGRLVNILDTPYEDVKGYGSPRLSAYGGLQLGL